MVNLEVYLLDFTHLKNHTKRETWKASKLRNNDGGHCGCVITVLKGKETEGTALRIWDMMTITSSDLAKRFNFHLQGEARSAETSECQCIELPSSDAPGIFLTLGLFPTAFFGIQQGLGSADSSFVFSQGVIRTHLHFRTSLLLNCFNSTYNF